MKLRRAFRWEQIVLAALFSSYILHSQAAAPSMSNVRASQRAGTQLVDTLCDGCAHLRSNAHEKMEFFSMSKAEEQ